ncbi:MAG: hypothetical protein P9M00_12715 [Candidatus Tritonobacter lacicola]|nr:hypothetical protein [Candidatus Tritonobacter lacicola]
MGGGSVLEGHPHAGADLLLFIAIRSTRYAIRYAKYDGQFRVVFEAIRQLMAPPEKPRREVRGFKVDERRARYKATKKRAKKKGRQ